MIWSRGVAVCLTRAITVAGATRFTRRHTRGCATIGHPHRALGTVGVVYLR